MATLDLLVLALKITLLPLAALAGCHLLRGRSAAARHLVLALGMAGLAVVPLLALGLPGWKLAVLPRALESLGAPLNGAPASERALMSPLEVDWRADGAEGDSRGEPLALTDAAAPLSALPDRAAMAGTEIRGLRAETLLLGLWLVGFGFVASRIVAGLLRLRWIVRRGTTLGAPDDLAMLDACCRRAGLETRPGLICSEHVDVPVVWGWLRPYLVVPAQFISWAPERRQVVLLHELGHLTRSDWPVLLLGRLVISVYWFHPLVWYLERRTRRECERACDDLVVRCGMKPSEYAHHLLSIARGLVGRERPRAALAVVRRGGITDRLRSILNPLALRGAPSQRTVVLAGVALVVLLLPFASLQLSTVAHASDDPDPNPEVWSVGVEAEPLLAQNRQHDHDHDAEHSDRDDAESSQGKRAFEQGYKLHGQERWQAAIESFQESADAGFQPATCAYNIACGYARMGDATHALQWLERANAEGFDSLEHMLKDSDLDSIRSDARFQQFIDRAFEDAGRTRGPKDYPYRNALEQVERLQRESSTDAKAWYKAGMKLLQMRELDASILALDRAVELMDGESTTAMYNLACAYSLAGKQRDALGWLERAVTEGFDYHERFVNDTDLDNLRGNPEFERISAMSETLSMEQFSRRSWESSDYSERRWAPAVEVYEDFVDEYPKIGRGWFNLGYALHYSGRFDEAIDALERAESLGFRPATAAYNQACANAKLGRTDAAFECLDRAVENGFTSAGHLMQDEDLDGLRADPRYEALLEKLPEPDDHEHDFKHELKQQLKKMLKHDKKNAQHKKNRIAA